MTYKIIGAGMAGMLAAAMLREECKEIYERGPEIPNNHHALLRFRTSIVGDTLGVPFKKVAMMKAVVPFTGNPVGDAIAYSLKTNGKASLRSSISATGELSDRYIAPPNLIDIMSRKVTAKFYFNGAFGFTNAEIEGAKIISTIPMTHLASSLGYQFEEGVVFETRGGTVISATLDDTDVYASLYFPDPAIPFYRASITGNRFIIEFAYPSTSILAWPMIDQALIHFGMRAHNVRDIEIKKQSYAKIVSIDDRARKRFMMWATDNHNIFSLGRFATWRPGLLLDDVVKDVRVIQSLAENGTYSHRAK